MEILRFEESDAPAPKKKRPSKGLLALGLVAALMGIGTAFASSTIDINTNNKVQLGQGVASTVTCQDEELTVQPFSSLNVSEGEPFFYLSAISISNVNDNSPDADGIGCRGKDFRIQIWDNSDGVQQITCSDLEFNKVSIEGTGPDAAAHCSVTDGSVYFAVSDHTSYMMKFNLSNINADKFAYITVEAGNYFDPVASPIWGYPV